MDVEASSGPLLATGADTLAIGLFADEEPSEAIAVGALLELARSGEARAKLGHVAVAHDAGRRFLLVGLGERERLDPERARRAAAVAHARADELSTRVLGWESPAGAGPEIAAGLVEGTLLHAYRFGRYKPAPAHGGVERLIVAGDESLAPAVDRASIVTGAQNRARDLGNTPANDLPPSGLADYSRELAGHSPSITAEIWGEERIRQAGMGAFAAVARGSAQDACMIELRYEGPGAGASPLIAMIGKAITFDSGGISLKPNTSMHEMKFDMAGGAAVIEAISALAELQAPVRVIGIVGAAENLPSGTAVKPGDIVRALDGTTIEVENTDAEGRLVLADCLCHARREGAERLVDIATLTGGIVSALGSVYAGLMSNDDSWAELVRACGEQTGELLWRMPLHEEYARMVHGRYAELTNRAERREAQPLTAAELLHHFVGDVPWAHLDIAGTGWDVPRPYFRGKGATGFGVRLLVEVALASVSG